MKRYCPHCGFHWAWKLNDGRFKCRKCGKRYTFRSVWQFSRLSERVKLSLLKRFSQGLLFSYAEYCRTASDRFFHLTRMTIAYHEHYTQPIDGGLIPFYGVESLQSEAPFLVLGMYQNDKTIRVFPVFGQDSLQLVRLVSSSSDEDGLYYTAEHHAFGLIPVRGNQIYSGKFSQSATHTVDGLSRFWTLLHEWLIKYGAIPLAQAHLFLGEISFRYHNRDDALYPTILDWIMQTPTFALKEKRAAKPLEGYTG